jgi:hypothetical protein
MIDPFFFILWEIYNDTTKSNIASIITRSICIMADSIESYKGRHIFYKFREK